MTEEESANLRLLKRAWKARNELYQELFGDYSYVLPKDYSAPKSEVPGFKRPLAVESENEGPAAAAPPEPSPDEEITVLAYAPNETRPYWMYLTAGLSSPWFQDKPQEVSGFGCELMLKSAKDARWAVRLLRRLAYYIHSYSGTLSPGVILSMEKGAMHPGSESDTNNIFCWYADEAVDAWYDLPSGGFGIFVTVGITEDECRYAESIEEYGVWCIQQVLRRTGIFQVTDPTRPTVMNREGIDEILDSVRAYAENFRASINPQV